jgi:membrane protease YdiL (CAAX protease family)
VFSAGRTVNNGRAPKIGVVTTISAFMRRHPAASYFVLAIAISWSGILAIVLPTAFPAPVSEAERLFVLVYLAMLAGPSVAGLTITAVVGGREALRDYWNRLLAWRVGLRWYAVALCTAPLAMAITLLSLSLISTDYLPSILSGDTATAGILRTGSATAFVLTGLGVGVGAGFFEELGWSGVAVPRLLERLGLTTTGLTVGIVWGAWHFLAIHWGSANAIGTVPVAIYLLVALFSFLVPYRILMTWVYQHTRSTLIGVLMHASLTSSMLILGPPVSGAQLLTYDLAFGATLWIGVLVLVRSAARPRAAGSHLAAVDA